MGRYRVFWLIVMILTMLSSLSAQSPHPYIYYYDYLRGGLVIERADGGDSRLIADLIPEGHNAALAPEWSVSGQWFASKTYEMGNQPRSYLMGLAVVSSDGLTRHDLGISEQSLMDSEWSPTDDVVLVMSGVDGDVRFWLWDADSQMTLAEYGVAADAAESLNRWQVDLTWSADGTQASALWGDSVVTLSTTGEADSQTGRLREELPTLERDVFPSPDDVATGLLTAPPQLQLATGDIIPLFAHSASTAAIPTPFRYRWSADGEWGWIDYEIQIAGGGESPKASVLFNRISRFQRELPIAGEAGFLPEQALAYLGAGSPQTALKAPIHTVSIVGRFALVGWHPTDSNRFVVYSDEDGLIFWALTDGGPSITAQVDVELPLGMEYPIGQVLRWFPEQERVAVYAGGEVFGVDLSNPQVRVLSDVPMTALVWTETSVVLQDVLTGEQFPFDVAIDTSTGDMDDRNAVFSGVYGCCVQVFDVASGALIEQFYATAYSLALSPDGRWLATTSAGKVSLWALSDESP